LEVVVAGLWRVPNTIQRFRPDAEVSRLLVELLLLLERLRHSGFMHTEIAIRFLRKNTRQSKLSDPIPIREAMSPLAPLQLMHLRFKLGKTYGALSAINARVRNTIAGSRTASVQSHVKDLSV